jgi:hypothetical protein
MKLILAAVLVASLLIGPAEAQGFTYSGQGTLSCGTWMVDRREGMASGPQQWVSGFLSGVGFALASKNYDPLHGVDADGVWAWIDNYCRANPIDIVINAAEAFVRAHPR